MGTRTSFRPRPLDTLRQLNIVRDVKELDDGEQKVSRDIVHSHEALDKDNEEVHDSALRRNMKCICRAMQYCGSDASSMRVSDLMDLNRTCAFLRCPLYRLDCMHSPARLSERFHVLWSLLLACRTVFHAGVCALLRSCQVFLSTCCQSVISNFTGMCRLGWCPANRPKVAKRFQYPMSESYRHTALSTCLFTRSLECTSGARVITTEPPCLTSCMQKQTPAGSLQYSSPHALVCMS